MPDDRNPLEEFTCPAPLPAKDTILLGHGSGGRLSADLLREIFLPAFQNPVLAQLEEGRAEVENQYIRSVGYEGNRAAQELMEKVFEVCDRKWRGIGVIPQSGFRLREAFAAYDADKVFGVADTTAEEPAECISAQVLQGLKKPVDCPAFAVRCTPETPLGAPMVSAEGACAAYYQYRRPAGSADL